MSDSRAPWITGTATIVGALITGGLGFAGAIFTAQNGQLPDNWLPKETITVTATHTVTASVPEEPSEPTPKETQSASNFLADLDPVEGRLETKSVSWRGDTYPRSLVNPLSGCSQEGPVDWVIPPESKFFRAEVGVDAASVEPLSKVTFIVYLDGSPLPPKTLAVGAHAPVEVPLADHSRIRLESIIDESRRNNCNTEAIAVWGNARLDAG
jgi:NPCBM/NEW2 domain